MQPRELEKTSIIDLPPRREKAPTSNDRTETAGAGGSRRIVNRRAWVRWPCDLEVFCQHQPAPPEELWWLGRVRKISRGGIRLLLSRRFEPETVVRIEILTSTGSFPRTLAARVVHASPLRYGGWSYGCALLDTLSEEEVRGLID